MATPAPSTTDMYPPPPSDVIQQLTQGVVECISFGKYTIHFRFENGNRLSFSAPFRFGFEDCLDVLHVNEFPLNESCLIRVLGCPATGVTCEVDGTLHLRFSNGDALVVYANDPMYEAYTLFVGGIEYVV
ncbi:MAG: hypothetical protein EXS05_06995 [Planctomycetaceae bacterium]|nr:hypothetical protein [Planctomycetaceae bacterium]